MRGLPLLKDWKFILGEPEGVHLLSTDDSHFKTVDLPHDWSVAFSFDQEKGESCTGYLLGGIGWYRKHFMTTKDMAHNTIIINCDGIYNRATIYCNGKRVTFHPYGYSPCLVDVTDYLNPLGEDNVIAIKVDHTRYADSRWYTGSGIYRKVSMHILPMIHIPVWGISVTTPRIEQDFAIIRSQVTLHNTTQEKNAIDIVGKVYDGNQLIEKKVIACDIEKQTWSDVIIDFEISNPVKWEIHHGKLYDIKVEVVLDGRIIQTESTRTGIREFYFDADKGFFLNGSNRLIKGVCLHHDAGLVGAAVPLDVWKRRLKLLKECGCNAIRTAHNPASEDFLDLCDEMGFLVQEEFFDEWDNPKDKRKNGVEKFVDDLSRGHAEFFREYAKEDVQNIVKRDRNHPCIFQWSIGNEIEWTYTKYNNATGYFGKDATGVYTWTLPPYSKEKIRKNINKIPRDYYDVDTTARQLTQWTKAVDRTRPVLANCILPTVSYETGFIDELDIVGYSYRRVIYDYGHENYPKKPIMGTENMPQWHEWKAVLEKEHIPGIFIWTGIDHMGEGWVQKLWPRRGSNLALLDFAGFKKPAYHMFKSLWRDEPHIKMFTQRLEHSLYEQNDAAQLQEKVEGAWQTRDWFWHDVNPYWNYQEGESIVVEAYSNCDHIALYLNDALIATRYLKDFEDHIYKWHVPFVRGTLKAIGVKDGETIESVIQTVGAVKAIELEVDKNVITTDGDSVVHVIAKLVDEKGNVTTNQEARIDFAVEGANKIRGVDNGCSDNVQDYQSTSIVTHQGKCLMIVQGLEEGTLHIQGKCVTMDLVSNLCTVEVQQLGKNETC